MKRWISAVLVAWFCLSLPLLGLPAAFAAAPEPAPLVEDKTALNGMIRVWLSSIRGNSSYNLTVSGGAYTVNGVTVTNGGKIKVEFSGGTVYVTANGTRLAMGSSATVSRLSGGVKIAESLSPSNAYPGDMRFFYSGGTTYAVCYLFIEDYVNGVLPFEMDNNFPLEALKAQAVTARTYAIRAKTTSGVYDVTDTTAHQVFRGVDGSKKRCIQAVDETWGVVIKHNGNYAGAYYSASNGGQTETNNHVWGGSQLGYLEIKEDPYDLANPRAVRKTYFIYASPSFGSSASAYEMIRGALAAKYGGSPANYTINAISDILLHTPLFAAPSRLFTRMQVILTYNGGISATVDMPIFPTVKASLGLVINNEKNELFTVEKEERGFRVTARRYGHGVGMSQRGAEQMAEMGYNYAQILGFYFKGIQRVRVNFTTNWPESVQVPPPAEDAPGVQAETYAKVSLANPSERLNLRKEASATSEILAKIPSGVEVPVQWDDGTWCKVRYGNLTGYVSRMYLRFPAAEAPSDPQGQRMAMVTLASGSLNLRSGGDITSPVVGSIPNGAKVNILEKTDAWSKIRYNNQTGYVMSLYLTIFEASSPPAGDTVTVNLLKTNETLNLRLYPSTKAPILALLRHGTALSVLEREAEWTKVTYQSLEGYVVNQYIADSGRPAESPAPGAPAPTTPPPAPATPPPEQPAGKGSVTVVSGSLNLRAQPNVTADVLFYIPYGAEVDILNADDAWCEVRYMGMQGFVMRAYLAIAAAPAPPPPSAAPTAPPDNQIAWVWTNDGDRLNLRRSASSGSTVLDRISHGTQVTVLEWGSAWTKVAYGPFVGYVSTGYLTLRRPGGAAPDAPQQVAPPAVSGYATAWVATRDGGALHLRQTASAKANSLALVQNGAQVTLLEVGAQWCRVIYGGMTGYMLGDYLSFSRPSLAQEVERTTQATPAPVPTQAVVGDRKTTINSGQAKLNSPTAALSLRAEPNDLAKVQAVIGQGARVDVLEYYGMNADWLYVRSGTAEGYALTEHFLLNYRLARVNLADVDSRLSVRASASASANAVASLSHGAIVTVLSEANGWAMIRLGDLTTGYVAGNYLVGR